MNTFTTAARGLAVLTAATTVALAVAPTAAIAQETDAERLDTEMVASLVKPSVVYVGVTWTGYVGGRGPAGYPEKSYWSSEITQTSVCTGFVVDPSGYVVTAGHCVDPQEMRADFVNAALDELVEEGTYTYAETEEIWPFALSEWELEGPTDGSPVVRRVDVYQTEAASGIAVNRGTQAQLVDFRPLGEGDAALLKIQSSTPLPALELADEDPAIGADVTSIGYPASVADTVDPGAAPSFKTGRVSSEQIVNGVPYIEIDAAMSGGMSGGPTVDADGRVVGINSWGPSSETDSFNFVSATSTIRQLLARNGVDASLSDTDVTYRQALAAFAAEDWDTAVTLLDRVLAVAPSHAEAQSLRSVAIGRPPATNTTPPVSADSTDETANSAPTTTGSPRADGGGSLAPGAVVAVLAVLAGIGIVIVVLRKRSTGDNTPCPACDVPNPPSVRFCGSCGHALAPQPTPTPSDGTALPAPTLRAPTFPAPSADTAADTDERVELTI